MTYKQTKDMMRKAVPLARKLEGDWTIRMKLALKETVILHYLREELNAQNVQILLAKGCSQRRICKHHGVTSHQLSLLK
ncbi:hypothetical protein [Listeria rustica]|uniref:Uncharacterized protein n=1 Tax=Listeria rustica TaxID=2713503 RepID=A0A7W1T4U0_9LIST|nr:hypothetical protein [Listeria rustica]MBA3925522.1 hypothetical protein [Listeria rustica]